MARYDYCCEKCGHVQEVSHPMSGPVEVIKCEKCECTKMSKTFLGTKAPGVIFKGDDWATNKYR